MSEVLEVDDRPRVADRFVVEGLIGRGGSARVYRAMDELLGREVALKVFSGGAEEGSARHLIKEMRTLATVAHPGVVTLYDAGWAEGSAFIVMGLVPGGRWPGGSATARWSCPTCSAWAPSCAPRWSTSTPTG